MIRIVITVTIANKHMRILWRETRSNHAKARLAQDNITGLFDITVLRRVDGFRTFRQDSYNRDHLCSHGLSILAPLTSPPNTAAMYGQEKRSNHPVTVADSGAYRFGRLHPAASTSA